MESEWKMSTERQYVLGLFGCDRSHVEIVQAAVKLQERAPIDASQDIIERSARGFWNVNKNKQFSPVAFIQSILTGADRAAKFIEHRTELCPRRRENRSRLFGFGSLVGSSGYRVALAQ